MEPVRPLMSVTPAVPPPPPLVRQVGQVRLPAASRAKGPEAETATVPVALGIVIVLFEPDGVENTSELVIPELVAFRLVLASPCKVKVWVEVPTVKEAVGV